MDRKATIFLMLFMLAGCLPSADYFVIKEKKNDNSLLQNIDESNSIRLDIAMVQIPLVEKSILESIWSLADNNSVGLEKKAILEQNGFRITSFGKNPPPELLRLLGTEKYTPNPRRFYVKIGGASVIPITGIMDSLDTTLSENETIQDINLLAAQAFFKISPVSVSENYYHLKLEPLIKSGKEKLLPKAVKTVSGSLEWEMHSFKSERFLDELGCELKVEEGDFLVIGPSESPKDDLKLLGSNFFYTRIGQNIIPRVLVLRCSKKNAPLSDTIGEFGKSLPLAIQASWKNFQDDK
ncbi:MAG: hypothetical protein EBT92_09910 [Planctomycetes bacterium]|nr:hypothetical protein [Planctomycetota bacterium]NBY02892.1 hypothetical protein [Planctomycetota bacterium]